MKLKRMAALLLSAAMVAGLAGCGDAASESTPTAAPTEAAEAPETAAPSVAETAAPAESIASEVTAETEPEIDYNALVKDYDVDFAGLTFDETKWVYDSDNDVYYQIGVQYCAQPAALDYETLAVVVPGAYLTGMDNGDGTYTCTSNPDGTVNGFTAETAPMMMPVNTAGYSAQTAATSYSYSSVSAYLDAGYVYVYSGCRGRSNGYNDDGTLAYAGGAPWGVTDLKAAVRYLRLNNDTIPGDPERIFAFGHSGGGAQSAVLGASGDSALYFDYQASIGAAMYDEDGNYISDAICGAMCWCPITSLDYADEAYEWNMGQYMDSGTRAEGTWTKALSQDLAACYGEYLNQLGLKDDDGNAVRLVNGTWTYTVVLNRAAFVEKFNAKYEGHEDLEPNEETTMSWTWNGAAWTLVPVNGLRTVGAIIEVICEPKAPTADDLKKLEMAVQVKCVVDASQQHTNAYGLLGECDEDYFVGEPRKDGDDWLCDIS